jgi:hypothetical protein
MKLRPKSSFIMTWILSVALTLSPVMAQTQNSPGPIATDDEQATSTSQQEVLPEGSTTPVVVADGDSVGTPVPAASSQTQPEAAYPKVERTSTMLASQSSSPTQSQADSPGKSKWIVLAALIATGAVVAAVLLFRGFGGGDDEDPETTVITAGPPTVNAPSR